MIPEDDLHALAELPVAVSPNAGRCRPVTDVLARGNRLRRRRQAVRAAGVTVVVGTVAATGTLAVTRDRDTGHVEASRAAPEAPEEPPPLYPDPFLGCPDGGATEGASDPAPIPPAEIGNEMRVLPTWTPEDLPITSAVASRRPAGDDCGPRADDRHIALELAPSAPGDVRRIIVTGPWSELAPPGEWGVGWSPTQVRGRDATLVDPTYGMDAELDWTEPDGGAWRINGVAVDDAETRALAEALQLDSSPAPGTPAAQLAPGDIPAGWEIVEQATTLPPRRVLEPEDTWSVTVGTPANPQTGTLCRIDITDLGDDAPFDPPADAGSETVTVDGEAGLWSPLAPSNGPADLDLDRSRLLWWELGPGLQAMAECSRWDDTGGRTLPLENVIHLAESVEPVAAGDPRIPNPPTEPAG